MPIESVMPSNHLILCYPLLLPSVFPSIRDFSNESVLCIRWPRYWSFSLSIRPSNEYSGLISFRMADWISLQSNTTVQKHQFFNAQLSLQSNSHIHTWLLEKPWLWLDGPSYDPRGMIFLFYVSSIFYTSFKIAEIIFQFNKLLLNGY